MKCPDCGAEMVLRTAKATSNLFWGCSNFPACKKTLRYVDEDMVSLHNAFKPTAEQQAIFDHISAHKSNLIVNAVAGSGKTTTILQALHLLPKDANSVFLAFNKSIAENLAMKAPAHIEVRTLHSLGYRFIKAAKPGVELDSNKVDHAMEEIFSEFDRKRYGGKYAKLLSLAMNNDVIISPDSISELLDYYSIDVDLPPDDLYLKVKELWLACQHKYETGKTVSFDDFIYWPAMDKKLCSTFDYIFVDESQDLNRTQMRFIMNCTHNNTLVVCVGDRRQSIYGFRGADVNAIDYLKDSLAADELPLSICFRCPSSHIEQAQKIEPSIKAREGAPEGEIKNITVHSFYNLVEKEDLVISRLNAPLLPLAFQLIRQKKPAVVRGRDIGQAIQDLLRAEENKSISDAEEHIAKIINKKVERLYSQDKIAQATYWLDLADCCFFFLHEAKTVKEAREQVYHLFDDNVNGIVLSSVHKAKGLEATRVFIIDPQSMPLNVRLTWEKRQERNLMYVALTRAKDKLFMVTL